MTRTQVMSLTVRALHENEETVLVLHTVTDEQPLTH